MPTVNRESYPLQWPEGWTRTRPQDRRAMNAWKRTSTQYRDEIVKELARIDAPSFVISSNVPLTARDTMTRGLEPLDVGVAIYFSRKVKEDFAWQDALNIHDPAPSEEQVQNAFRRLAALHHPDKGGDITMFQAAVKHRDNALRWINRKLDSNFDYVIANDQFREVRLNMAAISMSLKALRQLDRCGSTGLLERAFRGFSALPEYRGAETVSA